MTRIVRSLFVFCESFSKSTPGPGKCTFSFCYVLFLTSFALYHINQVRTLTRHLLFDFSHFSSVVKCIVCSFIINVVGKSGIHVWSCSGNCQRNGWVDWRWMGSLVSREPINHEDLVNVGKLQQVFL